MSVLCSSRVSGVSVSTAPQHWMAAAVSSFTDGSPIFSHSIRIFFLPARVYGLSPRGWSPDSYSDRSATFASTRDARSAGIQLAANDTPMSVSATTTNTHGSLGDTLNKSGFMNFAP